MNHWKRLKEVVREREREKEWTKDLVVWFKWASMIWFCSSRLSLQQLMITISSWFLLHSSCITGAAKNLLQSLSRTNVNGRLIASLRRNMKWINISLRLMKHLKLPLPLLKKHNTDLGSMLQRKQFKRLSNVYNFFATDALHLGLSSPRALQKSLIAYFYPKIQLPLKVPYIEFDFDVMFSTLLYPLVKMYVETQHQILFCTLL